MSPDAAENVDMVVCVFTGEEAEQFKRDNIYTVCADCGSLITHRPLAPKKPPKDCIRCAKRRVREAEAL